MPDLQFILGFATGFVFWLFIAAAYSAGQKDPKKKPDPPPGTRFG